MARHPWRELSFERYLLVSGGVVIALFTILDPSGSAGLGFAERVLFWSLHALGALLLLTLVQRGLDRSPALRRRPFLTTGLAGFFGAWLFAPLALGIERFLGMAEQEPDDDWLDRFAERWGPSGEILTEALELSLPVSATWLVINLPWLLRLNFTVAEERRREPGGQPLADSARSQAPPAESSADPGEDMAAPIPVLETHEDEASSELDIPAPESSFLGELPSALGQEVISLSSQLHYLEVRTTSGKALVLYNLRDAARELEAALGGMQIHRSHWVADRHVRRLAKRGSGWFCELSSGLELPVSRRKVSEAKDRWGSAAQYIT